ncbi:tetratricopeptide repeat protein [Methyloversatilis thermotolerans]|uniref:tetratricopeptide repeat protein n=1 Tax=Methyloversatilis thermotolerans TaxID=1346290 RepID=UPI000476555F|nr:tetratricopeptide repeat protein [Methyloversatilis thermotolerans]
MKARSALVALLVALALPAAHAVHPQREQARVLVAQQRYAEALELLRPLAGQYPDDSDLLIEIARVEGFADHNARAADLYESVLARAPQRRDDVIDSLAWQSLWAGRHARAIELFRARMHDALSPQQGADVRRGLIDALRARFYAQVERGDSAEALATADQLDAIRPPDADALAERARLLARMDRNRESAASYARAIERAPERRREWLAPYAWQTLWSGDAHAARTLFAEAHAAGVELPESWRGLAQSCAALDRHPCAVEAWQRLLQARPDDRAARLGLARALLWSDRTEDARIEYEALVARDPQDRDARIGLAQAQNFGGRHRAAVQTFDSLGTLSDEGERVAKARALYWAGYADQAMPLLEPLEDPNARWLRDWRIRREVQNYASAGLDASEDADRLFIVTPWALAGWRLSPDRNVEVGLRLPHISGRPVVGNEPRRSIDGRELSVSYGLRLGDVRSRYGSAWTSFTVGARDYDGWSSGLWRARARYLPTDRWRVDAEAGNGIIDTVTALRNQVDYRDMSLGAEFRPVPEWSLAAGVARLDFDDGNTRNRLTWRADRAIWRLPKVLLGIEGQTFDNSRPWNEFRENRGYYNPDRYIEGRIFAALYGEKGPWTGYAKAGIGRYHEKDGWGSTASGRNYLLEGWIAYDLGPGWQLRAAAGMSDSEAGSPGGGSGYWRRFGSFSVNAWW